MPAILRCFRIAGFLFSKEGCYITSVIGENEKLLIVANGAYGKRMKDICEHARINHEIILIIDP